MSVELDIVVVAFESREDLGDCLGSLRAAPPSRAHRVVVVDNASTDGTADALRRERPEVRLLALDRNLGFAAAANRGIRDGDAPLVLLLNPDARARPGAIDALVERLEATGAAAAGPRLVDGDGRPELSFGAMPSPLADLRQSRRARRAASDAPGDRAWLERLLAEERTVDWLTGACLLVRRDAAVAVGLLDERYFLYLEDADFGAALRARGGRLLFTPRAEVIHLRGRSLRHAPGERRAHSDRSRLAFYAKHHPAWLPLLRLWLRVCGRLPAPAATSR